MGIDFVDFKRILSELGVSDLGVDLASAKLENFLNEVTGIVGGGTSEDVERLDMISAAIILQDASVNMLKLASENYAGHPKLVSLIVSSSRDLVYDASNCLVGLCAKFREDKENA